jgi:uncharacterized membrane protein
MRKTTSVLWTILVILFIFTGMALLIFLNMGFAPARSIADLLAKDGSADPFTHGLYQDLRLPGMVIGFLFLTLSAAMLVFQSRSKQWVSAGSVHLRCAWSRFARDSHIFAADFRAVRFSRSEALALSGIVLLAVIARIFFVMQPFKHDEAYTVAVFANQPLRVALSDYHLPNNHLFHTFLVHLVYSAFGYLQWAVRLPSFVAGVLTVPALYLLSRTLHGRTVAFIAAAAAAVMPVLVDFSTQARGYTLLMLFSLLLFLLGVYVRRRPNLLAWVLVVVVVVLGIYTIPIFYFSYISFLFWLGLAFVVGDINFHTYGSRWSFIKWGFISCVMTVVFTVLLYTPPALRSGLQTVLPYQVSDPLSYGLFLQDLNVRLTQFVELVLMELPFLFGWVLVFGFVLSLFLPVRSEAVSAEMHVRVPLQIAVALGTFGLIFALRAPPWARFITFLVPLVLMWAAAGWVGLVRWLQNILPIRWKLERVLAAVVLLVVIAGTLVRFDTHRNAGFDVIGYEEAAARFLHSQLKDHDFIVVSHPRDAAVWYYAHLYRLNPVYFRDDRSIQRAFVLVDTIYEQTLEEVIAERGPRQQALDLSSAQPVFKVGTLEIFELTVQ